MYTGTNMTIQSTHTKNERSRIKIAKDSSIRSDSTVYIHVLHSAIACIPSGDKIQYTYRPRYNSKLPQFTCTETGSIELAIVRTHDTSLMAT